MTTTEEKMYRKTFLVLYNLMLALWVGGIFIYTFLVTPVLFSFYGRDSASAIVDKLFPFYFPYILAITGLALGTFLLSDWRRCGRPKLAFTSLIIAALISLFINFALYPEMRKIKQEISSFEKIAIDSPARRQFRALHGISMILNLVLLADGIASIIVNSLPKNTSGNRDSAEHL